MNIKLSIILRLLLLVFMASVQSAGGANAGKVLDEVHRTGVIHAPYPDIWPPAAVLDANGQISGFDVEVLKEITKRLGVKLDYVKNTDGSVITWKEQTSGEWQGKYDVVVGGMAPTAERAFHLSFPVIYRYGMGVLAVNTSNTEIKTPADASRRKIGVLKSSIHAKYLKREDFGILNSPPIVYKIDDPIIVEFEHEEEALDALSRNDGTVDAILDTAPVTIELIKSGRPFKVIGLPLYRTPVCVAILPGDDELATVLKQTVDGMRNDGTLSKLALKWYEYDMTAP